MKNCPNCHQSFESGGFCPNCGAQVPDEAPVTPVAPVQPGFCSKCGEPLAPGVAFCAKCGQPVNAPVAAPKAVNPAFKKAGELFKKLFMEPKAALDAVAKNNEITTCLIPAGVLLVSFLLGGILFAAVLGQNHLEDMYGACIGISILLAILYVIFPTLVGFVGAKLNHSTVTFVSAMNVSAWAMTLVAPFVLIAPIFGFMSLQLAMVFILALAVITAFLHYNVINYISNGVLASAKTFWATFGIDFAVRLIITYIIYAIVKSAVEDAMYGAFGGLASFLF